MRRTIAVLVLLLAGSFVVHAANPYHLIKEIPIGGEGGWDYITVDAAAHRLYVSHATRVVVADIDSGKVVGEVPDTPGVHGFAIAPDLGRGFSSNGRANTSTIIDLQTLKPLATVSTGGNPDAIFYEPTRKEVYTMNGTGKSATVFDARKGTVVATIDMGGKPEAVVEDTPTGRLFVNIEDTGAIGVIDIKSHTLAATWPLAGCEEPTGLGYDGNNHRLFSACANKVMTVTDSRTGKHVTSVPIGSGADGAAFDPATGLAFASNGGDGTVTIAHLDGPGTLTVVQTLPTMVSGRTMILDPVSHHIFVPAAETRPNPSGSGRPQPVPGTFRVLMFGMQ
ncbi:MAG: YncE family protein [Acidobacteria bacterium]|nr:YncE family protein [Acidobacteriota bacterium]